MSGEYNSQGFELYMIDDVTVPLTPALLKISSITSIGEFGAQSGELDTTDLDSVAKEYIKGLADNGELALELKLKTTDVGHKLLNKLAKQTANTKKKFVVLGSGGVAVPTVTGGNFVFTGVTDRPYWWFEAFPKNYRLTSIGVDSVVKVNAGLRLSGGITSSMDV